MATAYRTVASFYIMGAVSLKRVDANTIHAYSQLGIGMSSTVCRNTQLGIGVVNAVRTNTQLGICVNNAVCWD